MGKFIDFNSLKSIKLYKNRRTFYQITAGFDNMNHVISGFYKDTMPSSNIGVAEGTIVYDGTDSIFLYYHIKGSGDYRNNAFMFIQT